MTTYYPAHLEGHFPDPEVALARTGLGPAAIAQAMAHARINQSPAIFWRMNEDYAALVTPGGGIWTLWRGFHGVRGSEQDAKNLIKAFRDEGVAGDWGIFEWVEPISLAAH